MDGIGNVVEELGLLKGQVRIEIKNDTVTKLFVGNFEYNEGYFDKVKERNKLEYPYVNGTSYEIVPSYKLSSSAFNECCVVLCCVVLCCVVLCCVVQELDPEIFTADCK